LDIVSSSQGSSKKLTTKRKRDDDQEEESSPNLLTRGSQKRVKTDHNSSSPKKIVFSGFAVNEINAISTALKKLKDVEQEQEFSNETTHVVINTAAPKRTMKVLNGISKGLWIVSKDWILNSAKGGRWLAEKKFEAHALYPGAKILREYQANGESIFENTRIFFEGKTNPDAAELKRLITNAGGKISKSLDECTLCISSSRVAKPKDKKPVVKESWVLNTIAQGKLEDFKH